jgi:DNA-binding transcriptional LysR family regulator
MRASPDDILGMAFFARVVEARSFSDAARSLGVSKSAVSARVARLEKRLGVTLLHRTTRRLALTADGVRLYEHCARVVAEADQAAEVGEGASAVPRGTLRVYAPPALAQSYLTAPIRDFMKTFPGVRIDLRLGDRPPNLAVDSIDIAIVVARRLVDSGLSVRKLASVRVVVCASPAYLRRKGIPFRPQDLVMHDCLSHSILQAEDWHFDTEEGPVSMATLSGLVVDDLRFLREAVLGGNGIAMFPEHVVAEDLAAGRLHRVLDEFQSIEQSVNVLHAHGRLAPASVRAFLEHLVSYFRRPPWAEAAGRELVAPVPAKAPKRTGIPMTEQDVRRLSSVAALYAELDAEGSAHLGDTLARARVMPAAKIPRSSVTINSRICIRDDARNERELSLVYPWDEGVQRVSVLSAQGRSLLGASVGGTIADEGRKLTIASIPYETASSTTAASEMATSSSPAIRIARTAIASSAPIPVASCSASRATSTRRLRRRCNIASAASSVRCSVRAVGSTATFLLPLKVGAGTSRR